MNTSFDSHSVYMFRKVQFFVSQIKVFLYIILHEFKIFVIFKYISIIPGEDFLISPADLHPRPLSFRRLRSLQQLQLRVVSHQVRLASRKPEVTRTADRLTEDQVRPELAKRFDRYKFLWIIIKIF